MANLVMHSKNLRLFRAFTGSCVWDINKGVLSLGLQLGRIALTVVWQNPLEKNKVGEGK